MEYYAAERKKELLPFATAWMNLESTMLSEISQAVKDNYKQKLSEALKGIKINKFKNCFEQWKKCLNRHFASNEEYFEGD